MKKWADHLIVTEDEAKPLIATYGEQAVLQAIQAHPEIGLRRKNYPWKDLRKVLEKR